MRTKLLLPVAALCLFGMSASGATYYVDPVNGNDAADGGKEAAWQTFAPLNARTLQAGDTVVVSPGKLTVSLAPKGNGTAKAPVRILFRAGTYEWMPEGLEHRCLAISNTSDRLEDPKAIAMELVGLKHYRIGGESGQNAHFFCRGKMVEIHMEECEHMRLSDFTYDYVRPTVSEYTAEDVTDTYADISIHKDSLYSVRRGHLTWVGEGWTLEAGEGWAQTVSADGSFVRRGGPTLGQGRVEELSPGHVRLHYNQNPGFKKGIRYQHRAYTRDCCGVFCDRSADISYRNVTFHFMHGMGIVSQFSRDLSFRNLRVLPRRNSGRTSAAWADVMHFSGCYGQIRVEDSLLTSANDDAINIHGTHLRLVKKLDDRRIRVRFMHKQTYGFHAFRPGDEVQFTSAENLLPLSAENGRVVASSLSGDGRDMDLTLEAPLPETAEVDRTVLENVTATPAVTVRNTRVRMITTRGFLLTSRRPILIENCHFDRTGMPALLMEDDANYWYESGPVHDMTVRGCTFEHCAEPVISFNPQVQNDAGPVHRHIRVLNNRFLLDKGHFLSAKWVSDLQAKGNRFVLPKGVEAKATQQNSEHILLQQ